MSAKVAPAASRQVLMFSPTCWIWARMSPFPTQIPCASRANWPATKIILPVPLTVTTWLYLARPSTILTWMPCGWIFSRLIAIAFPFRIMQFSIIRGERGLDEPDYPPARHFSAAVPPDGREPDGLPRPRPRIDGVARPARASRGLDRRAPFGRVRDHQLARNLHRDRRRAHQIHLLRHRRHLIALPQPADGGRPHRAARPPYARPGHVRRRAGAPCFRRTDARDRPNDSARPDGRGDRRDPAPLPRRDRHRKDRLVHARQRAAPPAALHEALS